MPGLAFVLAVREHWRVLVSGSLSLALMWLWNFLVPGRQLSRRAFAEVFGAFLLVATQRAFDDYRRRPRLEFFRRPDTNPYFEEFRNPNGARDRFLRVGLRNLGAVDLPNVWLLLDGCSAQLPAVHLEERLRPKGQAGNSFAVAANGTTIVDVLIEQVPTGQEYGQFLFAYASAAVQEPIANPADPIMITLRAEGGGTPRRCTLRFGDRFAWRLDELVNL